jgi:hypothetical protein
MGTYYILVNHTKKEWIDFKHCSKSEPIYHHSELIASYLHKNNGDYITFVGDWGNLHAYIVDEYRNATAKAYRDLICEYCSDVEHLMRVLLGGIWKRDPYKYICKELKKDDDAFKDVLSSLKRWRASLNENADKYIDKLGKEKYEKILKGLDVVIQYFQNYEE